MLPCEADKLGRRGAALQMCSNKHSISTDVEVFACLYNTQMYEGKSILMYRGSWVA